ncbi:MAG: cytochrome c oxidase subunit 2 [Candidatus Poriferisodalaceae bacterium]
MTVGLPRFAVVVGLLLTLNACGAGSASAPVPTGPPESYPQAQIDMGHELYRTTCQACHGAEGQGGVGLPLVGITARKPIEEHRAIVSGGRGTMPPFGASLTPEEIEAVIAYERATFG